MGCSWRAVWKYSATRAARDKKPSPSKRTGPRGVIAGEKTSRTPRFVKATMKGKELDQASIDRAKKLVGLKGYVTKLLRQRDETG